MFCREQPLRRLAIVAFLVLAVALVYRPLGSATTGTGNLTLPPPEPNPGTEARSFTARDTEGDLFEMTDSGVYVLTFWNTLNRNSNQARPQFLRLAREYGDEVSFAVVYVNGAIKDENAPYDRLHDPKGTLASRYNVKRVPRTFVIQDGKVASTLDELDDYSEDYGKLLGQEIDDAVKGQATRDPQTALKEN